MTRRIAAVLALVAGALVLTLAIPYGPWRTGRLALEPLTPMPADAIPRVTGRIWIDADPGCGHGAHVDPDDCLAILALAQAAASRIAGLSAVAGNAPLDVTQATARALADQLQGVAVRSADELRSALEGGPLTIVALGPLTNVAAVLQARPQLASNVQRLVAVMGRRPGHLFHPAEGAPGAMLLGHGPVFRDFNFEQDLQAAARVLALGVPITLIPYDAARHVEITATDLERLAARGGPHAWVAERSREWLEFWNEDIGRNGFYPFDLLAAAYVIDPGRFRCARVTAGIGKDPLFLLPWRDHALLVTQRSAELNNAIVTRPAVYCPGLQPDATLAGILG